MPPRKRTQEAAGAPSAAPEAPAARLMVDAVERTLGALTTTTADAAAVQLARSLAAAIDADERSGMTLSDLSSKLLAVLAALGATPAARKALTVPAGGGDSVGAGLDELRDRRARQRSAAAGD